MATHLGRHLYRAGHRISCIYSRTESHARALGKEVEAAWVTEAGKLPVDADFYLVSLTDTAVPGMVSHVRDRPGIWMHTAGTLPLQVFEISPAGYGVFYPLQTFSKSRELSLREVPILVEGSDREVTEKIMRLATSLTNIVLPADSNLRQWAHLAAVFANNFSNHMIHVADELLSERGLDPGLLGPLIRETVQKLKEMGAADAQTGPARRGDRETLSKQLDLLKGHPEWQKLYTFISRDIERNGHD